jgi:hypothetical protein
VQKWKKNQIFEAIKGVGLDPREFDFEDGGADVRIKHKWSESYFIIGDNPLKYVGRHVVGDSPEWPYEVYNWEPLMQRVSTWLGDVKRDLECRSEQMKETSAQLLALSEQVAEKQGADAHFGAVLAQVAFANQIFLAISKWMKLLPE